MNDASNQFFSNAAQIPYTQLEEASSIEYLPSLDETADEILGRLKFYLKIIHSDQIYFSKRLIIIKFKYLH